MVVDARFYFISEGARRGELTKSLSEERVRDFVLLGSSLFHLLPLGGDKTRCRDLQRVCRRCKAYQLLAVFAS